MLSLIVVVGWQYFFGYPQMEKQREQALIKQQEQAQTQPGAAQPIRRSPAHAVQDRPAPAQRRRRPAPPRPRSQPYRATP